MLRNLAASSLIAAALAIASTGHAAPIVERSGNTYHTKVCEYPAPGRVACHAHLVTDVRGRPLRLTIGKGRVSGGVTPGVSAGPYTPSQLRAAYGVTGSGSSATVVAIVDAYGYPNAAADLAAYRKAFGLGACTTSNGCLRIVNETGGTSLPAKDASWDQEQALDLDMVSAMCPGCRILLVQATSANYNDLAAAENSAARLGAHAIGNSYGGGESMSSAYESAYDHPGVAVTASAGDSGYGVEFPAASPHVIAVGGTSLVWNGSTRTETAWSGTGSGCSTVYAQPAWQLKSNSRMANNTLCKKRMLNDVSVVANPDTGVVVYMNIAPYAPGFYVFGGTSASAQIIAGIYGEKDDFVAYGSNLYAATALLNDVTSGRDGACGGTYFCTAELGYDGPTGLGTPNGDSGF